MLGQVLGHKQRVPQTARSIKMLERNLAEREGFEPPIRLPVCRISSAVLSTTQPPLHGIDIGQLFSSCQIA
jgi:hypothetical protein